MNKKGMFKRIVAYEVHRALQEVYPIITTDLTDKQAELIDNVSERLYDLFGDSVTVKDLQGKFDAPSKALQEN